MASGRIVAIDSQLLQLTELGSIMTLILNQSDWDELCQQAPKPQPNNLVLDDFENLEGVPKWLGRGYSCGIELLPGVWLNFSDREFHQDLMLQVPVHDHLIEILLFLSGFIYFDDVYPNLGGTCSYFSGSGISPAYVEKHRGKQRLLFVNVQILPELLESFFPKDEQPRAESQLLFKQDDWKVAFYPTVDSKMRSLAHQLWNAPYRGAAKRMYLQAKVFELLAIYLDLISANQVQSHALPRLKPDTISRLYHAKEILTTQLENPSSLSELAQQVGVSDRTLQRGFQELFGTTVFGYLHTLRMEQAEQLLRNRQMRVSEVAHAVGYSHLGHFTAAFKRKFGITPKQCQRGKVNILN